LINVHVLVLWFTNLIDTILFLLINSNFFGLFLSTRIQTMNQNVGIIWSLVELSLLNVAFNLDSENILCPDFLRVLST
jgi:hypothetical protein